MNTIYDVDYFIKKFEFIPERLFIVNWLSGGNGEHCANGWCGAKYKKPWLAKERWIPTHESAELARVFSILQNGVVKDNVNHPGYSFIAAYINNGKDKRYQQPTPKQRIIAALQDIKKLLEPASRSKETFQIPESLTEQSMKLMEVQS